MFGNFFKTTQSAVNNALGNWTHNRLSYVVEDAEWVVKEDGRCLTRALCGQGLLSQITSSHLGVRNQIVHFASINTFFNKDGWNKPHPSNKVVVTWFHVVPDDPKLKQMGQAQTAIDRVHTSCRSTQTTLVASGVSPDKITVIPLGIESRLFHQATAEEKQARRKKLGIPEDRFVIGSFQKDGNGWGEGLEPKLIKGPDVFVETIERLKQYRPFVLLVGPARGYVKRELEKRGIEYKHVFLKDFAGVPAMFHALDLYVIASRIEGGPKAILEAWASGVPLVSTKVGMVPDIARDGEDALLAEVEDVDQLSAHAARLIEDEGLRERLVQAGLSKVKNYGWDSIAKRYYKEIYKNLL